MAQVRTLGMNSGASPTELKREDAGRRVRMLQSGIHVCHKTPLWEQRLTTYKVGPIAVQQEGTQ